MKLLNKNNNEPPLTLPLFLMTLLVGIGAGLGGMLLVYLLHFVQHVSYGYDLDRVVTSKRFLAGVSLASPERRVIVMVFCGLIAGLGWWAIYRFGKPPIKIEEALKTNPSRMPRLNTILHALLQMITVAMGSPLGREVPPRELAALFACWVSTKMGFKLKEVKVLTACAAGAGLAAVYNVPFGGMMFTLEVLLANFDGSVVLLAFVASITAVVVSRLGLGDVAQFQVPSLTSSASLILWSIVTSPIFGVIAFWFRNAATRMGHKVQHNWQVPVFCLLNFTMIGLLAIYFPVLLGNGRSPAQVEFDNAMGIGLSALLFLLRMFITLTSIRAGAHGGVLTPSLANGALLAVVLGCIWRSFGSEVDLSAFAIVGSCAFLAAALKMPMTAVILIFEFTRVPFNFLIPVCCAVFGAVSVRRYCSVRLDYS